LIRPSTSSFASLLMQVFLFFSFFFLSLFFIQKCAGKVEKGVMG
jgi:hypothetical protein